MVVFFLMSFSFTLSMVIHYINIMSSLVPTEAPLFGSLHAAVLLCLCPEVSPLLHDCSMLYL